MSGLGGIQLSGAPVPDALEGLGREPDGMFSVTRSQLIACLAKRSEVLSHGDVEAAVKIMIEHLAAQLAGGGRIEIRGFGAFSVRPRRGGLRRNPGTGALVERPATQAVHFRAGKALRERVDAGGATPVAEAGGRRSAAR